MWGPKSADVLPGGFHPEGEEQPVIVIGHAILPVNSDIEFVSAVDEIVRLNRHKHHSVSCQLTRIGTRDVRVGAVTAHAMRIEDTDAKRKVVDALVGPDVQPDVHALT